MKQKNSKKRVEVKRNAREDSLFHNTVYINMTLLGCLSSAVGLGSLPVNPTWSSLKNHSWTSCCLSCCISQSETLQLKAQPQDLREHWRAHYDLLGHCCLPHSWGQRVTRTVKVSQQSRRVLSCAVLLSPCTELDYWLHLPLLVATNAKCCSASSVAFYIAFVQRSVLSPICAFFCFTTLILCRQRRSRPAIPHGRSCVTETSPRNSLPLNFLLTSAEAFSRLQVSVL